MVPLLLLGAQKTPGSSRNPARLPLQKKPYFTGRTLMPLAAPVTGVQ